MKFIKRLLGIDLIEYKLDVTLEELSQDDVKIFDKVRRLQKDISDLLIYLNVERKEEWKDDLKFTPPQPKLISSKWIKKQNETND